MMMETKKEPDIRELLEKIEELSILLKHCENDSAVAKEEYASTTLKYLDLVSEVNNKNRELTELKNNLEEKVKGRTAMLEDVNAALKKEIRKHRKTVLALKESEKKYRVIFENAIEGIYQSTKEGRFISANPALARMIGYSSPEELIKSVDSIGRQFYVRPEERKLFMEMIESTGFVEGFEVEHYRKDGETFLASINARAVRDKAGNIKCYEGILQDISERRRMEEELMKEKTLESIGTLAGGIAHDFNNLLMAITGYIFLAHNSLSPDDQAYITLKKAEETALKGKNLTQQLITFSKGGAPYKRTVHFPSLIKGILQAFPTDEKIETDIAISDDAKYIMADDSQLRQAVANIIRNACEAMPGGGVLSIKADAITIEPDDILPLAQGHYITISIGDTGAGICPENLPKIFDPYFTTKMIGDTKGMGLGLAIAYSIVKKHEGYVTVKSFPSKGTLFTMYLPTTPTIFIEQAEQRRHKAGSRKILFMDDEESLRDIGSQYLTNMGFDVFLAKNGEEAIEIYKRQFESRSPIDAVMLDLNVKIGMGGKEAMERLIKIDPSVKAIVSSGYVDDPVMSDYMSYGFLATISKPYSFERLQEIIHMVLDISP